MEYNMDAKHKIQHCMLLNTRLVYFEACIEVRAANRHTLTLGPAAVEQGSDRDNKTWTRTAAVCAYRVNLGCYLSQHQFGCRISTVDQESEPGLSQNSKTGLLPLWCLFLLSSFTLS